MQHQNRSMLCPVCQKQMTTKIMHGQQIDECENRHGLWVDEGELTAMLKVIEAIPEPPVPPPMRPRLHCSNDLNQSPSAVQIA